MARFDADTNGTVLKFVANVGLELAPGGSNQPAGTVFTQHFDEETNAGIVTSYQTDPTKWSMPGGTLTQTVAGQAQQATVNPPKPYYQAFLNSAAIMARLNGGQYAPTQEELAQIAAAAFRANGFSV